MCPAPLPPKKTAGTTARGNRQHSTTVTVLHPPLLFTVSGAHSRGLSAPLWMLVGCACLNVCLNVSASRELGRDDPAIPAGFLPAVLLSRTVQLPSLVVTTTAGVTCSNCRQVCFRARGDGADGTPILYHESLKVCGGVDERAKKEKKCMTRRHFVLWCIMVDCYVSWFLSQNAAEMDQQRLSERYSSVFKVVIQNQNSASLPVAIMPESTILQLMQPAQMALQEAQKESMHKIAYVCVGSHCGG